MGSEMCIRDRLLSCDNITDSRLRSEALLKFEGYNDVQITTLFLNLMPTVTQSATVKLQKKMKDLRFKYEIALKG